MKHPQPINCLTPTTARITLVSTVRQIRQTRLERGMTSSNNRPLCSLAGAVTYHARFGGVEKAEIRAKLELAGVQFNDAAVALFEDVRFTTSPVEQTIEVVEVTVGSFGFPEGATFPEIIERAVSQGLSLSPLELGPHLRLQKLDQPEGFLGAPVTRHRAPSGSITIASPPLDESDSTPKGFYLRRIEGVLWLRGYYADYEHVWSPEDVLVFSRD